MKYKFLLSLFFLFGFIGISSAHLMSDQGTNVILSNGTLLNYGNLTILLYVDSSGGIPLFNTTIQNAIVNGSWNLMINPTLEYGISYWKDYEINGEDLDFDGNERLEFQSPLGYINNFSFINLSMINFCPAGSAIRLVYSNGSVECQNTSGNLSVDLSNYALKNQSETFNGNITTLDRGFFGFLGSLANRIGKLFVNDIDASGNIVTSENVSADYFIGDGSLLANLPAGAESDPLWSGNSTSVLYIANLPLENRTISHISNITGFSFNYNQTDSAVVYINSQGFLTSSSANATYLMITDLPLENRTRVHCSNITGAVSNLCTITSSSSVNLFDQVLNTSSNVTFANITITDNSAFAGNVSASTGFFSFIGNVLNRITKIFAVDLDLSNNLSASGNISSKFYLGSLNYSTFPTTTCSGSDKVIGVNFSGGVVCGTDQTGSGTSLPVKHISILAGAVTDTNPPATERIVGNSQYLACTNVTGYSSFRYGFARSATSGATNAIVYMKYIVAPATSITGSSYTNLSSSGNQLLSYTAANRAAISDSFSMASNLGDICIGAFQVGGDGVLDPQWRNIWIELN